MRLSFVLLGAVALISCHTRLPAESPLEEEEVTESIEQAKEKPSLKLGADSTFERFGEMIASAVRENRVQDLDLCFINPEVVRQISPEKP